jgi:hypothetical protein
MFRYSTARQRLYWLDLRVVGIDERREFRQFLRRLVGQVTQAPVGLPAIRLDKRLS